MRKGRSRSPQRLQGRGREKKNISKIGHLSPQSGGKGKGRRSGSKKKTPIRGEEGGGKGHVQKAIRVQELTFWRKRGLSARYRLFGRILTRYRKKLKEKKIHEEHYGKEKGKNNGGNEVC